MLLELRPDNRLYVFEAENDDVPVARFFNLLLKRLLQLGLAAIRGFALDP